MPDRSTVCISLYLNVTLQAFAHDNSIENIILLKGWNGRRFVDTFFYWISKSGDGYLYGLVGIILFFNKNQQGKQFLYAGLVAFALELPIHKVLKNSVKRIRPYQKIDVTCLIAPPDKYSFPSGHTSHAFLMANLLSYLFPHLRLTLFGWACLVRFSRVYSGVHYLSDIMAGIFLGITSSHFGLWMMSL